MRTRIKICGLTNVEDTCAVVAAGADAVGFVFAPLSPRRLETSLAQVLAATVPAFVDRVGLFQDQDAEEVATVLDQVPVSLLQFHGSETASYCKQFGLPYIKAVSMNDPNALSQAERAHPEAAGLVLDSHQAGQAGGTGQLFDWSAIQKSEMPLIIAGGLNPDNVFDAVSRFSPWAVDVSSGVEKSVGIKEQALVRKFIAEVERGNSVRN